MCKEEFYTTVLGYLLYPVWFSWEAVVSLSARPDVSMNGEEFAEVMFFKNMSTKL